MPDPGKLAYEIFIIELWHLPALTATLCLSFLIWIKAKRSAALERFMVLQGLFALWMIAKMLKTVAFDIDLRWAFILLQYLAVCFIGPVFLMFAYALKEGRAMAPKWEGLLGLLGTFWLLVVATNPWHMGFYATYTFYSDTFGPLFYMHMAVTYGCLLLGIFWLVRAGGISRSGRRLSAVLTAGMAVPLLFNLLYITKTYRLVFGARPLFDYTPICYSLALLAFGFAVFRLDLFSAVKAAAAETLEALPQPMALLDRSGRVHTVNQAMSVVAEGGKVPTEPAETLWIQDSSGFGEPRIFRRKEKAFGHPLPWLSYRLVTLTDVTEKVRMQQALQERNTELEEVNRRLEAHHETLRELAVQRERVRAARNLHDILGHTLVLGLSILEMASQKLQSGLADEADTALIQAGQVLGHGARDMDRALALRDQGFKGLRYLEERLEGIRVHLGYSGVALRLNAEHQNQLLSEEKAETALRAVQELVTNAVRHGDATVVEVYLRAYAGSLLMVVQDNGRGAEHLTEGFGLSGIRSRVQSVGGEVQLHAEPGNGVTAMLTIALSDQLVAEGHHDNLGTVLQVELAEQPGDPVLDGAF